MLGSVFEIKNTTFNSSLRVLTQGDLEASLTSLREHAKVSQKSFFTLSTSKTVIYGNTISFYDNFLL